MKNLQLSHRFHRFGNFLLLVAAVSTPAIVAVELLRAALI